jgi:hypothetical protein
MDVRRVPVPSPQTSGDYLPKYLQDFEMGAKMAKI